MEIHATQPLWARVHLPEASAVRAAEWGCASGLQVRAEGVVGGMWLWERPLRQPCGPPPPPARAATAAPSEVRVVDPRLEGAERGFRRWLNAQAWRAELACPEDAAMTRDDIPAVVASHVLASYLDSAPPGLVHRLADWLVQHVAAAAGGSARLRWQWEVTILAWVCEACGLPELMAARPLAAEDLLAEAGFAARALRQAPFTAWRRGACGLPAWAVLPGLQHQRP